MAALDDAAKWLTARFGSTAESASRYGDVHQIEPPAAWSALPDGTARPMDGAPDTLFVAEGALFDASGKPRPVVNPREVPIYRMVIGFRADGTAQATVNYMQGASEDPGSRWYESAQPDWIEGTYRPLPFLRGEVDDAAVERWTIDGK